MKIFKKGILNAQPVPILLLIGTTKGMEAVVPDKK